MHNHKNLILWFFIIGINLSVIGQELIPIESNPNRVLPFDTHNQHVEVYTISKESRIKMRELIANEQEFYWEINGETILFKLEPTGLISSEYRSKSISELNIFQFHV